MSNIIQNNLAQIKQLMLSYGVQSAYAFGSAVKNTMHPDSDIDFVISFPNDMDYSTYGDNYFELLYALQDLLKTDVDLVAEETITNPYLRQSIDNNRIQVL
ncbi:nucleotidyltransferase family protein [Mucilaginibacter sp. AW1-3]